MTDLIFVITDIHPTFNIQYNIMYIDEVMKKSNFEKVKSFISKILHLIQINDEFSLKKKRNKTETETKRYT